MSQYMTTYLGEALCSWIVTSESYVFGDIIIYAILNLEYKEGSAPGYIFVSSQALLQEFTEKFGTRKLTPVLRTCTVEHIVELQNLSALKCWFDGEAIRGEYVELTKEHQMILFDIEDLPEKYSQLGFTVDLDTSMPEICFGTVQQSLDKTLPLALHLGIRHIDGADGYVRGEYYSIIRESIKVVPRDKLWITWKSNTITLDNIARCITNLDCKYIDLYLIHFGCGRDEEFETLKEAQRHGLIKHYGVSNCENFESIRFLKTKHDIYANQIQARPPLGRVQGRDRFNPPNFIEECNKIGVKVMLFGSIGAVVNSISSSEALMEYVFANPDNLNKINKYYIQKYLLTYNNVLMISSITGSSIEKNLELYHEIKDGSSLFSESELTEIETFLESFTLTKM